LIFGDFDAFAFSWRFSHLISFLICFKAAAVVQSSVPEKGVEGLNWFISGTLLNWLKKSS